MEVILNDFMAALCTVPIIIKTLSQLVQNCKQFKRTVCYCLLKGYANEVFK